MNWLILSLRLYVFAWATFSFAAFAAPLDVIGIKTGMPLSEALDVIKKHNSRMIIGPYKDFDQGSYGAGGTVLRANYKGLPPFIWNVNTWIQDKKPTADIASDNISLRAAPGSPEIVIGIRRRFQYQVGHERTIATIIAGLKEKYGASPSISTDYGITLAWYYDVSGKPITGNLCFPEHQTDFGGGWGTVESMMDESTLEREVKTCGVQVFANISSLPAMFVNGRPREANKDLAREVLVVATDSVLKAVIYRKAISAVMNYSRQEHQKEVGEATKRGAEKF